VSGIFLPRNAAIIAVNAGRYVLNETRYPEQFFHFRRKGVHRSLSPVWFLLADNYRGCLTACCPYQLLFKRIIIQTQKGKKEWTFSVADNGKD
jgi:hypothetical protein